MLYDQFVRLFAYDAHTNKTVFDVVRDHTDFPERPDSIQMLHHVVRVQELWFGRMTGDESEEVDLWPENVDLSSLDGAFHHWKRRWRDLLERERGSLDRTVSYSNSSGRSCKNQLSDLLHHVVIHGQHHRAQLAKMLRRGDVEPPKTDFIFYLREPES